MFFVRAHFARAMRSGQWRSTNSALELRKNRAFLDGVVTRDFRRFSNSSIRILDELSRSAHARRKRPAERYFRGDIHEVWRFLCDGTSDNIEP